VTETVLDSWQVGRLGEQYVAGVLALKGATVTAEGPADLVVNGVPLEVKTARYRQYKRGRAGYQFCIRRDGRPGLRAPFVALVCYDVPPLDLAVYVIPTAELNGQKKITIPSRAQSYGGYLSKWLLQWELLV
jgi:hypothetical protein